MTTQSARATQQQRFRDIIAAFAKQIVSDGEPEPDDELEATVIRATLYLLTDITNPLASQVLAAIHAERGWLVAEERMAS